MQCSTSEYGLPYSKKVAHRTIRSNQKTNFVWLENIFKNFLTLTLSGLGLFSNESSHLLPPGLAERNYLSKTFCFLLFVAFFITNDWRQMFSSIRPLSERICMYLVQARHRPIHTHCTSFKHMAMRSLETCFEAFVLRRIQCRYSLKNQSIFYQMARRVKLFHKQAGCTDRHKHFHNLAFQRTSVSAQLFNFTTGHPRP